VGVLLDLGEQSEVPWTLIGGQMVLLHALEHGTFPPQVSQDGDVIADVRAAPDALKRLVAILGSLAFTSAGMSPDGIAHRYQRLSRHPMRPLSIDVLAPEGIGRRADLKTTPPGRTVQVPGGTQALNRTQRVRVQVGDRAGAVPRPTLLGAVVTKAAACGLPADVSRHLRDLALLCALIEDPFAVRDELTPGDRKCLRYAAVLGNRDHRAWLLIPDALREQGRTAWAILVDSS
jgi:hypothetical protein